MYHSHLRGTHYEVGFRWGSLLLKHKNIILDHIPFKITPDRTEYASACIPVYEKYYPEILEEIQGLADGQQCDVRILQAVLFSMYVMPPVCNCSCFAAVTENEILIGRNSDFLTELEKLNLNVIYKLTGGAYSFTGNTTAFIEIEDGINEHGLAIGLTSVYPLGRRHGLNAGLLLRYFLEKCKTVAEVISCIDRLPIASAQTFTLADATGDIAVIECNSERIEIAKCQLVGVLNTKKRFVCATNVFHLPEMVCCDHSEMEHCSYPEEEYSCLDKGHSNHTEEGHYNNLGVNNWFAETRYQTLVTALSKSGSILGLPFAKDLLSGKHGFLCQYDRKTGKDTVWSVIYDVKRRKIYRSEGNPERCRYREDTRFGFYQEN